MDLTRGYWQVPVAVKDRHKTAFSFTVWFLPISNDAIWTAGAPATFQRMMDSLIHGAHDFTAVYLDDLVIL